MADSSIDTTSTGGTAVDTRTEGTNGNHRQVMVIGDPATNAGVAPVDATAGLKVDLGADNDVTVTGAALTSLELIDDAIKADDAAFTPGTTKVMMAGFEYDDTTPDSVDEGDAGAARMSARREIYTQIRDAAGNERGANINASGQLAVAGPVTNAGTFAVQVDGSALTALQLIDDPVATLGTDTYAEASTKGMIVGAVRRDANTTLVNTTNEVAPLQVNATGELKVVQIQPLPAGTNAIGKLEANSGIDIGDVDVTSVVPGTGATNLGKAEDAAHASGDTGVMVLSVRSNTAASTSGADGDYQPLITDTNGRLHVIEPSAASALTSLQLIDDAVYAEDAASAGGDKGLMVLAKRTDTLAASSGTDGDYEPLKTNADGAAWVVANGLAYTGGTIDVTRPADTTAYAINDAWSNSTSAPTAGGYTITGAARKSGGSGILTDMFITSSAVPGTLLQGEIHLFNQAATAINDNAAWALSDADAKFRVGIVSFTLLADASNSYYHATNLNYQFVCVGTANLRYLIKVKNAYTPISGEVLTILPKIIYID